MRALVVPVGADRYALSLEHVRELVERPAATRVPLSAGTVRGVFNLRGDVVPLLDTAALVGLGAMPDDSPFAVIAESAAGCAGLLISGRPETLDLGPACGAGHRPGSLTRHPAGGRVVTLLDIESVLAPGWLATT